MMASKVASAIGMSGSSDIHSLSERSCGENPDARLFPDPNTDRLGHGGNTTKDGSNGVNESPTEEDQMRHTSTNNNNDEGVEVILEMSGKSSVIDSPCRLSQDQNVFRAPHPVRPKAVRGVLSSDSYGGYAEQPSHSFRHHSAAAAPHADYPHESYHPVSYVNSGSFDQQDSYASTYHGTEPVVAPISHHSPHIHYPPAGGRRPEDLNVISPNHKDAHNGSHPRGNSQRHHPSHGPPHHPPLTPHSNGNSGSRYPPQTNSSSYHHYPPSSPASRPSSSGTSPPRVRGYGMRRPEGPYSAAQRARNENANNTGSWGYPTPERVRPPVVAESSFDSEHPYSSQVSHSSPHPTTPNAPHYGGPSHHGHHSDPSPSQYSSGSYPGSFEHGNSFDSHHAPYGPPSSSSHHGGSGAYYDHDSSSSYYGQHSPSSHHNPHESESSPYSTYSHGYSPGGNNYGYYDSYSPHAGHYGRPPPGSYDEYDRYHHHYPYHPHGQYPHHAKKDEKSGMILPEAASEVDFDVSDPPLEPSTPASKQPICESPADVNSFDVLCGRGGGTNSQVGNRRFRKLVQEFQPIYLLARRKEKPLLARTIVLIIRKRGGRFLKKDDETGELYEVGDSKAEAKTSQALREGLDVRATKTAGSSDKSKKKKAHSKQLNETDPSTGKDSAAAPTNVTSITPKTESFTDISCTANGSLGGKAVVSPPGANDMTKNSINRDIENRTPTKSRPESPPSLPKLKEKCSLNNTSARSVVKTESGVIETPPQAPPSPEQMQFRKRRRMRSADGGSEPTTGTCGVSNPFQGDKLFPDFCPPRAHLGRGGSPPPRLSSDDVPHMSMCGMTPIGPSSSKFDDDDIRYEEDTQGVASGGCAGIALDMMTGAAAGSFCVGPRLWSKRG